MGERYALIIGSTKGTNRYQKNLSTEIRDESIKMISDSLISLGSDYSYKLVGKRGFFSNPQARTVRNAIEGLNPAEDDVLLIYYHGHATIDLDNFYVLGFGEVTAKKQLSTATMKACSLGRVVETANARGFRKVVVIIDACFSGEARLSLEEADGEWALFSSTGNKVQIQDIKSNPFTREIANILTNPELREAVAVPGESTLKLDELALAVKRTVQGINGLSPEVAGPLSNYAIAPVSVRVPAALNERAPLKSLYFKIFRIARIFANSTNRNWGVSFQSLKKQLEGDPSFLVVDPSGNKVLISDGTLQNYIRIGVTLGFWESSGNNSWRILEGLIIDHVGSRFNQYLVNGILRHMPKGIDVAGIRRSVRKIIRSDLEPTYFRIVRQIHEDYGPWRDEIDPSDRRVMVRLLGYSHVLRRASSDTFFPR